MTCPMPGFKNQVIGNYSAMPQCGMMVHVYFYEL